MILSQNRIDLVVQKLYSKFAFIRNNSFHFKFSFLEIPLLFYRKVYEAVFQFHLRILNGHILWPPIFFLIPLLIDKSLYYNFLLFVTFILFKIRVTVGGVLYKLQFNIDVQYTKKHTHVALQFSCNYDSFYFFAKFYVMCLTHILKRWLIIEKPLYPQ